MSAMKWVISGCLMLVCAMALAAEPPVKKSRNGICHPQGGTYYSRTKHYETLRQHAGLPRQRGARA
ncbi:hypothetical protein MNZ22_03945 [Aeromonas encheleia]|nr:hypothetical protein [Aeromonas encheleia]UNP89559.1 hypothetical protein MNZ22_03945 [Aeromonas encheleia]